MGKIEVFWGLICLIIICFGIPVFASETGSLKVYVMDCETDELISGASVSIIKNDTEIEKITNKYGFAYFSDLELGEYDFSALAEDYLGAHEEADIYAGETTSEEICLKEETSEETELGIEELKIEPEMVCINEDSDVDISLIIELDEPDELEIKVKFYIYDGDEWDYIGSDKETLEKDEREKFKTIYKYKADSLKEDSYEIKAEIEYEDEEETEYTHLWIKNCKEKDVEEISDFEMGEIKLDPANPKIDEMVIGSVTLKLKEGAEESVRVEAGIDEKLEKSQNINFDYPGQTKTFEFAFDTSEYGIGSHEIKIMLTDGIAGEKKKNFYISEERYEQIQRKHCLRINEIKELNPLLKSGEKAEIRVGIENCGDYTERVINLKLENSGAIQEIPFVLMQGEKKEFLFDFEVSETEDLTISLWNAYNSVEEKYTLEVYSGVLSINLEPEYPVYVNESNKIRFLVENTGKVKDEFELKISENLEDWIDEFPNKIELESGELKEIKLIVKPEYVGDYEFEISDKTGISANSTLKVQKNWKFPITGIPTIGFTGDIISWVFLIILIIPILLIFYLVIIYLQKVPRKTREEMGTRGYLKEEKPTTERYR